MSWDPVWEDVFRQQAWGKYPGEDLIRFVARNFYQAPSRQNVKLLEVGCGPGANLWFMAREGFAVYGVDGSATAISQARERLDRECPGWQGQLVVGDIASLQFPDAFFDAVVDNEAICCNSFASAQTIYAELARVTKAGGKLFSRTFADGTWGDGTGKSVGHNAWLASEGPLAGKGYNRFTELCEMEGLARGFQLENVELVTRTLDGRRKELREWIIEGIKPGLPGSL
jgi:SAM-dependent methyltransferase